MLVQIWARLRIVSVFRTLNFTQDTSENNRMYVLALLELSHIISRCCNSFLRCAFRGFLLIWKEMLCFDLWVRNEIALSINDAFRMRQGPQIGVETRNGWPTYVYRLWGGSAWCADVQVCTADGGRTSLVQTTPLNAVISVTRPTKY
jgi:hypothetical protein